MNATHFQTRILLLVEDNPGDADLVSDLLVDSKLGPFQMLHVSRLADALQTLRRTPVDVVVLDLRLPDANGVDTVKAVRAAAGQAPIVVLTGTEDERVALACIDAGAQDYLSKSEVRAQNLNRAIGYAITRLRETQLREMEATLSQYRRMSSATQATSVTAALAGSGAIAVRAPEVFRSLVREYYALLEPFLLRQAERVETQRDVADHIITAVGDHSGGPRDLIDVHVAALDEALARFEDGHARSIVFEARLLALEMMGLLVDYYRVGQRRRLQRKEAP